MALFTSGWFHGHTLESDLLNVSYLDDCSPFYVILVLLVLEKYSQDWQAKEKFGCTAEVMDIYRTIEKSEA
jgi:hypothetical protein